MRPTLSLLRTAMLLSLALTCIGSVASAQDMYPEVEYISGHENMTNKQKGTLLIGDSELTFTKKDGTILFSVPFSEVTEVSNQSDIRDASVGKKLLWGGLAGLASKSFSRSPTRAIRWLKALCSR